MSNTVKLANNFEFPVESVQETYYEDSKQWTLNIRAPLTSDVDIGVLQKSITQQNIEKISVLDKDGREIDDISGYNRIISIDKFITNMSSTITVTARKDV